MSLGQRVLERRQALKMTQRDVANALQVTAQHVSLIEQDKAAPSIPLLGKLAVELGTSVDYLVSGKEGVITETIPAIKADPRLTLTGKKALIALVGELYSTTAASDAAAPKKKVSKTKKR